MFSKAERVCLNDPNAKRFSCPPITGASEDPHPGPASYHPQPPSVRSTRRHLFLKDTRHPLNEVELKNDVPGPGWYLSNREPEQERPPGESVFGSVTKRHLNMININNGHSLLEYDEAKIGKPGPANYSIRSTFAPQPPAPSGGSTGRGGGPGSPKAAGVTSACMRGPGRNHQENLDGRSFELISKIPAPGSYEARTPRRPEGGTISRLPRGLDLQGVHPGPAPGQYAGDTPRTRMPVRISGTPRNLGNVVCGTDLRKQRRYPGPASYHPIYKNIVKQDYTV